MTENWFSFSWFTPSVLIDTFEYERPWFLYIAIILPLLMILYGVFKLVTGKKIQVGGLIEEYKGSYFYLLGLVPWFFFFSAIAAICIALARPQKSNAEDKTFIEGIDIMLVLDISGSMSYTDIRPTRLEKTKELAADFALKRENDNVGVVLFSGETFVKAPLTRDKSVLKDLIKDITTEEIQVGGTAIGSGCALAVNMLRDSKAKSKIIILLSDGESNAGDIEPMGAAALADAMDVKLYTIGVGSGASGGIFGQLLGGGVDFSQLQAMADVTKGKFYHATSDKVLKKVFNEIDVLEKYKIENSTLKYKADFYQVYISWAVLFFVIFVLLRASFMVGMHRD